MHTYILFSRFYTLLSTLVTVNTPFIFSYFFTAQTAFHHCTCSFITAHFVHHCTLKQALLQRTNYISICLHVQLQPGCFAYATKPSSVVSASKRMERWKSRCSFWPYASPYRIYPHNTRGHRN